MWYLRLQGLFYKLKEVAFVLSERLILRPDEAPSKFFFYLILIVVQCILLQPIVGGTENTTYDKHLSVLDFIW